MNPLHKIPSRNKVDVDVFLPGDILLLKESWSPASFNGIMIPKRAKCVVISGDMKLSDEFGDLVQIESYITCTVLAFGKTFITDIPRKILKKIASTNF